MRDLLADLKKLSPLLSKGDRRNFWILLSLMAVASIMEAVSIGAIPLFVSMLMDPSSLSKIRWIGEWFSELPQTPTVEIVFWASFLLFGFTVLKNCFLVLVYYVQSRIVTSQRVKLSHRMFKVYQKAPYEWHMLHSTSEMLNNIQGDTNQVLRGVIMPSFDLIMNFTMVILIVPVLVYGTPGPALMGLLVTGFGVYAVVRLFQNRFKVFGAILRRENKKIIQSVQQGFGALIDARLCGCEDYLNREHRNSLIREAGALVQHFTMHKSTPYLIETFAILGLLTILMILVQTTESLGDALPVISLLGVATIRLKQLATRAANAVNTINGARAFIPKIIQDINELGVIEKRRKEFSDPSIKIDDFQTLTLEQISYSYPSTDKKALIEISLEIKKGESIALVGSTGSGKSTLVNIILGLLVPESGRVCVNGIDIRRNIREWHAHLGYIPQSIFLIDDTIRANVAFGTPYGEVDDSKVRSSICSACLDDFIDSLPDGLDTEVGEDGVRLSGGQRQRLGIARALYQNPDVLVMDEATSALDNRTEVKVMQAIQNLKKNRTLIMIAHRLSTVQECDCLYFLRNGRVEAVGDFDELRHQSDAFNEMALNKS